MPNIKQFISDFSSIEAKVIQLKNESDYNAYKEALNKYYQFLTESHKVYLALTSSDNPGKGGAFLRKAIIVHEENSEFKIIGFLTYTNYTEYGNPDKPYRWEHRYGSRDLSYDRFKNPMKTKRYDRPLDIDTEGLKVYDEDI